MNKMGSVSQEENVGVGFEESALKTGNDNQNNNETIIEIDSKINSDNNNGPRWDLLLMAYLIFTGLTSMAFGCSPRDEYHFGIIFFGILHFSAEMTLAHYLCFPQKIAFRLGVCTYLLLGLFNVACFFLDWNKILELFLVFFVFSDTYAFIAPFQLYALPVFPRNTVSSHFRYLCMGLSIHYIGPLWAIAKLPTFLFMDETYPPTESGNWGLSGGGAWVKHQFCFLFFFFHSVFLVRVCFFQKKKKFLHFSRVQVIHTFSHL